MQKVYCFNDSGDDYIEKDLVSILIDKGFSLHYSRDEHRTKIVAVKPDVETWSDEKDADAFLKRCDAIASKIHSEIFARTADE